MTVSPDKPLLTLTSDWTWFPRRTYPWERIGGADTSASSSRPVIHPSVLTAYVNYGCHFEGYVNWTFEETEVELLPDGWVRRRLKLRRGEQGGFYNNANRFKCELLTRHRALNALLGRLVTMGQAPVAGFQSALVQGAYMNQVQEINRADRVPGSFADLLYETFKSIISANAMDANETELDVYTSPDGDVMEFGISRDRTVRFVR